MSTKPTVLFVDDEKQILNSLKRGLLGEPYEKLFANSGKEACDLMVDAVRAAADDAHCGISPHRFYQPGLFWLVDIKFIGPAHGEHFFG